MNSRTRNIIMAGMLLFTESILMPLYPADDKKKLNYNNCSDYVLISGETNINRYNFLYNKNGYSIVNQPSSGQIEIAIPVKEFIPSSQFMYNDFLTLLKEHDYPFIYICFSGKQLDLTGPDLNYIIPEVRITIAGITRTYNLKCSVKKCSGGLLVMGTEPLKLSDFQLQRIERLGGLIKLRDEISVNFGFILNFTDNSQISSQR